VATIVVDELITKLDYEHDESTLKQAEKAVKQLEATNKAAAQTTDELAAKSRQLAEASDALTKQQLDLSEQIAKSSRRTDDLAEEQRKLKTEVKQSGTATGAQTKRLRELDSEIRDSRKHTKNLRTESARLGREKQKLSQHSRKLARQQSQISRESRKAASAQRKLAAAMDKASAKAREEAGAFGRLTEQIKGVAVGQLAADALRTVAQAGVELGRDVLETGASFESLRARLKTVEGSSRGAAKAFSLIQDFTATTPFQLEEVTTAFVRLKSLGLDASQRSLTAFGNIAAAQGKSIIDFIEAVADASTGEFERLKEFGIKASKQGEQVTFTFKGQQTVVKNTAADIQAFLKGIGESDFAGAMADQMATTSGAISNFKDTVAQAFDRIAQQGPLEKFNELLAVLSESIAGDDGLGTVIADVLVLALDTVKQLFEAMPTGALGDFLQGLVHLVGELVQMLVDLIASQTSVGDSALSWLAVILELVAAMVETNRIINEFKSVLGELPFPVEDLISNISVLLEVLRLWNEANDTLMKQLEPLLDAISELSEGIGAAVGQGGSFEDVFVRMGAATRGFAEDIGLVNTRLQETADIAGIAMGVVEDFYRTLTTQQLTERRREGDTLADAELRRRAAANEELFTQQEEQAGLEQEREERRRRKKEKQDKALAQFEGQRIKDASDNQLAALLRDPNVPAKLKKRVEKEQIRRERDKKKKSSKAAQKMRESLLTADIDKQIEKLSEEAGRRAAARAQLRGGVSREEINKIELTERRMVKERLTSRFMETGELPPGLAADLVQAAAIPNIEQAGGRLAPPVVTVNNQRIEVKGNTFRAEVMVQGGVSATPQQVADAVVSQAQPVTFQDLAVAIQNQLTSERR
jgi:hypothetical protein